MQQFIRNVLPLSLTSKREIPFRRKVLEWPGGLGPKSARQGTPRRVSSGLASPEAAWPTLIYTRSPSIAGSGAAAAFGRVKIATWRDSYEKNVKRYGGGRWFPFVTWFTSLFLYDFKFFKYIVRLRWWYWWCMNTNVTFKLIYCVGFGGKIDFMQS